MALDDFANGRMLGQTVRQESVVINGKPGQTIELLHITGQIILRNGEVWTLAQLEIDHLRKGSGSFEGHNIMVHPDGSSVLGSYKGTLRAAPKSNRYMFSGDWQFVSGTGRAAGIKGGGKFKGSGAGDKYVADMSGKATKV